MSGPYFAMMDKHQLLLKVPDSLVRRIRRLIKDGEKTENSIEDVIKVEPDGENFIFTFEGEKFPAMLGNLPTIVETHKTYDKKLFLKSGDIGQALYVFKSEEERDAAKIKIRKTLSNSEYMPDGLTPPTAGIVKSRFEKTWGESWPKKYPFHRVAAVQEEIRSQEEGRSNDAAPRRGSRGDTGARETNSCVEIVCEEVVAYEDWMVSAEQPNGVSFEFTMKDLMTNGRLVVEHPEILEFEVDVEEEQLNEDLKRIQAEISEKEAERRAGAAAAAATTTTAVGGVTSSFSSSTSGGGQSSTGLQLTVSKKKTMDQPMVVDSSDAVEYAGNTIKSNIDGDDKNRIVDEDDSEEKGDSSDDDDVDDDGGGVDDGELEQAGGVSTGAALAIAQDEANGDEDAEDDDDDDEGEDFNYGDLSDSDESSSAKDENVQMDDDDAATLAEGATSEHGDGTGSGEEEEKEGGSVEEEEEGSSVEDDEEEDIGGDNIDVDAHENEEEEEEEEGSEGGCEGGGDDGGSDDDDDGDRSDIDGDEGEATSKSGLSYMDDGNAGSEGDDGDDDAMSEDS